MVADGSRIRIASRGSELALWQTERVKSDLQAARAGLEVEIEVIRTTGDRILDVPLAKIGDRGLFTKELDEAILDGRADLAVHSLKDVPTRLPEGLTLAAISQREDPRDVILGRAGKATALDELPAGARVGTSSLRRRSQLRHKRPDLDVVDLRGNLNTRLAKLDAGEYDAIILAAAGVIRLGWSDRISETLEPDAWLPAVGQGALALVSRSDDNETRALVGPIHDEATAACVTAERAFLRALEGGCQVPIGALATLAGDSVRIDGLVADMEGEIILRDQDSSPIAGAAELGKRLASTLLARGAGEILREIRRQAAPPKVHAP